MLQRLPSYVSMDRIGTVPYLIAAAPVRVSGGDALLTVPLTPRQREIDREIDDRGLAGAAGQENDRSRTRPGRRDPRVGERQRPRGPAGMAEVSLTFDATALAMKPGASSYSGDSVTSRIRPAAAS